MTTFTAEFFDVEAVEPRVVTPDGRVTGLSKFKGREIKVVVIEEPSSCATITYGAGIEGGVPLPRRTDRGAFSNVPDGEAHIDPMSLTQTYREHGESIDGDVPASRRSDHGAFLDLVDSEARAKRQTI